jgi:hypothetical protein
VERIVRKNVRGKELDPQLYTRNAHTTSESITTAAGIAHREKHKNVVK